MPRPARNGHVISVTRSADGKIERPPYWTVFVNEYRSRSGAHTHTQSPTTNRIGGGDVTDTVPARRSFVLRLNSRDTAPGMSAVLTSSFFVYKIRSRVPPAGFL